ncbi:hypothetical protein A2W24_06520 [Microgenomates group bacterium RBG_16_45_19]|nr:MAG: hypothetical protein A2W24_06520 [Microgenomates group bacterium RBG_16_45_19]
MAASTNIQAVIDASYLLAYLMPDETNPQVDKTMDLHASGLIKFYAPLLLIYEVISGLNTAILRHKITFHHAQTLLTEISKLHLTLTENQPLSVLKLAQVHHLSAYDSSYLELAQRLKIPLYSLDKKLTSLTPQ